MEQLHLKPALQVSGVLQLPGSKSIPNRTLLLAALAKGNTEIRGLLKSDDTDRMLEALAALGIRLSETVYGIVVEGCNGNFKNKQADLFLGNAGTAFRPLTSALAFSNGDYHLHGVPRMHERPIGDLVSALVNAGAQIDYLAEAGFPPLHISPARIDVSK
ncbi:MAG: 3-phosphoshikimate 1-carboxyvinyltransferase, partial [Methylophilaceae bacterium]|nr:3-phosphoshikimate 1-carboxyvinyltransferase [Methylophilaceae bacterium]